MARFKEHNVVIVTRHPALVALLRERGLVGQDTPVLTHVEDPQEIREKHVFGVLPLHLAALAASVTEIPLALTPEDRGKELAITRLREIAGAPRTFTVRGARLAWQAHEAVPEGLSDDDDFWPAQGRPGLSPEAAVHDLWFPRDGGRRVVPADQVLQRTVVSGSGTSGLAPEPKSRRPDPDAGGQDYTWGWGE